MMMITMTMMLVMMMMMMINMIVMMMIMIWMIGPRQDWGHQQERCIADDHDDHVCQRQKLPISIWDHLATAPTTIVLILAKTGSMGPKMGDFCFGFAKQFHIVADYLRETEDILSYEPFLGVADPPQEAGGSRGGVTSR